jgi:hypothetical protein
VGVTEIEGKIAENARKHAYYKVLLAAEDTHLHNEPVDIKGAQGRADWPKWEAAMHEELKSLERHRPYEWVNELPPGRKAVGYKWVFKLKLNPDNSIAQYKARSPWPRLYRNNLPCSTSCLLLCSTLPSRKAEPRSPSPQH